MSEVSGIDDYVAWLTFRKKDGTHSDGRIRICDSDSPGAFKVYRAAPISAARVDAPAVQRETSTPTIYCVRPLGSSEDVRAAAAAINRRLGDSGDSTSRREAEREIAECHPAIRDCLVIVADDAPCDDTDI